MQRKEASKNEPARCKECRDARKASRRNGNNRRELHPAVCADCGAETQVPFVLEMTDQSIAVIAIKIIDNWSQNPELNFGVFIFVFANFFVFFQLSSFV